MSKLFAGTPRLFLSNMAANNAPKVPTSTTAAAAAAFFQQGYNLHSNQTFGSKLNTRTNKQGNTLITPKVNTVGNDPETHRKLLEKMFQQNS